MDLHAAALEKMLAIIGDPKLIDRLARDDLVGSVLLLYGLHPLDLETRVHQALEQARPLLRSHGGNVELVSLVDGVVRLRLLGSCHGCPSSALTLKSAIEDAIFAQAPDVPAIEVEGERGSRGRRWTSSWTCASLCRWSTHESRKWHELLHRPGPRTCSPCFASSSANAGRRSAATCARRKLPANIGIWSSRPTARSSVPAGRVRFFSTAGATGVIRLVPEQRATTGRFPAQRCSMGRAASADQSGVFLSQHAGRARCRHLSQPGGRDGIVAAAGSLAAIWRPRIRWLREFEADVEALLVYRVGHGPGALPRADRRMLSSSSA